MHTCEHNIAVMFVIWNLYKLYIDPYISNLCVKWCFGIWQNDGTCCAFAQHRNMVDHTHVWQNPPANAHVFYELSKAPPRAKFSGCLQSSPSLKWTQYVPKATAKPHLKSWCTPNTPFHMQNVTPSEQNIWLCITPSAYGLTYDWR